MTDRIEARLNDKDKRKALKHGWTETLPTNPVEEKIEATEEVVFEFNGEENE